MKLREGPMTALRNTAPASANILRVSAPDTQKVARSRDTVSMSPPGAQCLYSVSRVVTSLGLIMQHEK